MNRSCIQPGCPGQYGDHGYCEECGTRAPVSQQPAPGPVSGVAPMSAAPSSGGAPHYSASVPAQSVHSMSQRTGPVSRATQSVTGSMPFTSGSTRSRVRGGMRDVPLVPARNPAEAILADPSVPESKRSCGQCHKPVGRRGPQGPGRTQGFCPHCRHRFSFVPSLNSGDMVASRYEILGAMAHGGLGWVYLARDQNIGDDVAERWVVLKGLIDTSDPDAIEAAIAERRFLAALDHPNIVQIYDFVRHPDPRTNEPLSYIVMEYIPGRSLRDLRRDHTDGSGNPMPLPLSQVLTYASEILPALGYLHQQGLLYCDFKPDNVIHVESWLKLIDLGAVRRIDDRESAVFGTPGYAVTDDEIINHGPSVSSDLYTIARSMAVMAFDFHGFSRQFRNQLPSPQQEPLFARYESFHRLLLRATHPVPEERFTSAEDMREQLLGVRQEVVSVETGQAQGNNSVLFTPEPRTFGVPDPETGAFRPLVGKDVGQLLPLPLVDSDDPSAGFLATLTSTDPMEILFQLQQAPVDSPEVKLRRIRTNIAYGNLTAATINLDDYAATTKDWRITWWRGVIALLTDRFADARNAFDWTYSHLPGEIAPTLALAAACELSGEPSIALGVYSRIWQTDRRYVSSGFGQARLLAGNGHSAAAVGVLDSVPSSSNQHTTAQVSTIGLRLATGGGRPGLDDIRDAANRLSTLDLPPNRKLLLTARILDACLTLVGAHGPIPGAVILNHPVEEKALRFGLEHTYRELALTCSSRRDRIAYIDQANTIRPWTLV
ncbi:tetratricopeptide repeat protein [Stackebrandtia soli]|uniref:serine/threonine-protein kinase n=1 Tax=Stackebrandtia soli TaxID=1892856 RepID=UPI0039EC020E